MNHVAERTNIGRKSHKRSEHHKTKRFTERRIESEMTTLLAKGKRLGADRVVGAVFHAMRHAGVLPRIDQAPRDCEIEEMLSLMESAARHMPAGDDAEAFRRNFAIANDRYAAWKFGKPVAPKKMPPPASAEQLAIWGSLIDG